MSDRLTKEELKRDEFKEFFLSLIDKIQSNKQIAQSIIIGIVILIIGIPVFLKVISNKKEKSLQYYNIGSTEYIRQLNQKAGNYNRAIEAFKQARNEYENLKTSELALINIGNCYLHSEKFDEAISYYDQFINRNKLEEFTPIAKISKAQAYILQKKYTEAEKLLKNIIEQYPKNFALPEAKMYLANIYFDQKKYDQTVNIMDKFITGYDKNSSWNSLAKRMKTFFKHGKDIGEFNLAYSPEEEISDTMPKIPDNIESIIPKDESTKKGANTNNDAK